MKFFAARANPAGLLHGKENMEVSLNETDHIDQTSSTTPLFFVYSGAPGEAWLVS